MHSTNHVLNIIGVPNSLCKMWQKSPSESCLAEVRELSFERNHRITAVRAGDVVEQWDRTRDGIGTEETEDTELGKTSIVKFGNQPAFLGFFGHLLVESKRIVQVQDRVDGITELAEGWVFTRLAALGVVGKVTSTTLVPKLKGRDNSEDLPLGTNRDGIPLLFWK